MDSLQIVGSYLNLQRTKETHDHESVCSFPFFLLTWSGATLSLVEVHQRPHAVVVAEDLIRRVIVDGAARQKYFGPSSSVLGSASVLIHKRSSSVTEYLRKFRNSSVVPSGKVCERN